MTLDECRQHIDQNVIYSPRPGVNDRGQIVRVNDTYAMVRYPNFGIAATRPEDLRLEVTAA